MDSTALVLIDIQKGLDDWDFFGGKRNNPLAEENMAKVLTKFRDLGLPIFHVKHSSQNPKSPLHASKPGFEIKKEVKPIHNEPIVTKNVNSAFIGTDLQNQLVSKKIKTMVVAGLTTNHCISSSVRMAANLGFEVILIADACAAFDQLGINGESQSAELVHQVSLANLNQEFAQILNTYELLRQLK